jgi:formate hydrogenlyase subunit 6/NADH:ubiquinone oxidoreductase subunit I
MTFNFNGYVYNINYFFCHCLYCRLCVALNLTANMEINKELRIQIFEIIENQMRNNDPPEKMRNEPDIAKATWVKAKGYCKIFWERSDLKWHTYSPHPIAQTIREFVDVVEEDKYGCFWG